MIKDKYDIELAAEYLSGDSFAEDDVKAIVEHAKTKPSDMIDFVDGVSPWQKVELEFTCEEFLEMIEY
tara:strand:+ start:3310 stop:3513 length:204 start_codon:yes stop_codon:yes gene_type:complete